MDALRWRTEPEPQHLLYYLVGGSEGLEADHTRWFASGRKFRLFAAAAGRLTAPALTTADGLKAVLLAERLADHFDADPADAIAEEAGNLRDKYRHGDSAIAKLVRRCLHPSAALGAFASTHDPLSPVNPTKKARLRLVHEIFGNPWRKVEFPFVSRDGCLSVRQDPSDEIFQGIVADAKGAIYSPWLTKDVKDLAVAAYESRAAATGFMDPLALQAAADALEEAGCGETLLINHLRGLDPCSNCAERYGFHRLRPQEQAVRNPPLYGTCWHCHARVTWNALCPGFERFDPVVRGSGWEESKFGHVRGCWAIDLLLGRR